jgi:non-homologous end joining protein Ku
MLCRHGGLRFIPLLGARTVGDGSRRATYPTYLRQALCQTRQERIDTKAAHFDPKKFEDHYETALVELLRKKQEGRAIEPVREEGPAPRRVINLMDALRASIGAETEKKPRPARAGAGAGAKRKTGR